MKRPHRMGLKKRSHKHREEIMKHGFVDGETHKVQ